MSKKSQLKKAIDDCEREIRAYEQKNRAVAKRAR